MDNSAAPLVAGLDASLVRMEVGHVDLVQGHRREAERPIEEVVETLMALKAKGKERVIGFSGIAPASLRRAAAVHPIDAVQSASSLQTPSPDLGLVQACAALGTTLVAFMPVGRSLLTDDPVASALVAGTRFLATNPRFSVENHPRNLAITEGFCTLARIDAELPVGWAHGDRYDAAQRAGPERFC